MKERIGRKKLDGTEDAAAALPSVHWTAPEVLENTEASSKASDIYSFGIILWELITREDPYEGMSPTGTISSMSYYVPYTLIRRCDHQ